MPQRGSPRQVLAAPWAPFRYPTELSTGTVMPAEGYTPQSVMRWTSFPQVGFWGLAIRLARLRRTALATHTRGRPQDVQDFKLELPDSPADFLPYQPPKQGRRGITCKADV